MKLFKYLMWGVVLLAGCATGPSPQVTKAAQQYQSVKRSMSRDQVYVLLGQPQITVADGRLQWRVSERGDTAELTLRFSPEGKITEIEQQYLQKDGVGYTLR